MSAILKPRDGMRPMSEDDLEKVMAIEEKTYQFPWTLGIFRDCLHVGYCCWVYENENEVNAYGIMSIGAGEAHILTVVVDENYRRQGLGRMMVEHLIHIAQHHKVTTILLEVRPSNSAAINLYHTLGFNEVGVRPNYYPAEYGREDAIIMARSVMDGAE